MEFPIISREGVFLDLVKVRSIVSSERKENASLLPNSHGEVGFRSRHRWELYAFSIFQYLSKMREVFRINQSSTCIENAVNMVEAHSITEFEVNFICPEFLLWDAKYVQLR